MAKLMGKWIANAYNPGACQSKFNPKSPVEGFRHCKVSKISGIPVYAIMCSCTSFECYPKNSFSPELWETISIEDQVQQGVKSFTDEYEDAIDVMKQRVRKAIADFHKSQRFDETFSPNKIFTEVSSSYHSHRRGKNSQAAQDPLLDDLSPVEILCHCIDMYGSQDDTANASNGPRKVILYKKLAQVSLKMNEFLRDIQLTV